MNFDLPADLVAYLGELDLFIDDEIVPLQQRDDNERFFDHRREWARTDFDNQGLPRPEWEALLKQARRLADAAGHWRFALPAAYGGSDGSNLWMAVIREHLAAKGLGLHNDLQTEHSIVGNNPFVLMLRDFGTPEQQAHFTAGMLDERLRVGFGLTEAGHGSDATHMETTAVAERRDGAQGWRIDGEKMWTTGMHIATHCMVFARTSGERRRCARHQRAAGACRCAGGEDRGIPVDLQHAHRPSARQLHRRVGARTTRCSGEIGGGLAVAQHFVHENRIRQAASSLGAADYCVRRERAPTRASASPSARSWRATRASSSRWWNWPRRSRCCAC